jgi:REP element-mobilizing transposase RayT
MGTHYHLVLEASRAQLSDGMRRLNGDYARRFNRRHGRRGHLFEERFSSFVLRDERHLEAAVAYVLQNPVRAGLCAQARDWQWSAAAAFG